MTTQAERDQLADVVLELLNAKPRGIYGRTDVKIALTVAANAVRRGRNLTESEMLLNLANGLEAPMDGDTDKDRANAKDLADRIRRSAALSGKDGSAAS